MPESRGKGLKPPKVDYNLKFLGLYAFLGISFSYLKLTHGKPLCIVVSCKRMAEVRRKMKHHVQSTSTC